MDLANGSMKGGAVECVGCAQMDSLPTITAILVWGFVGVMASPLLSMEVSHRSSNTHDDASYFQCPILLS